MGHGAYSRERTLTAHLKSFLGAWAGSNETRLDHIQGIVSYPCSAYGVSPVCDVRVKGDQPSKSLALVQLLTRA